MQFVFSCFSSQECSSRNRLPALCLCGQETGRQSHGHFHQWVQHTAAEQPVQTRAFPHTCLSSALLSGLPGLFCSSKSSPGFFSPAVASTVKQALQDSLVQILQPKRRVDILRDVLEARSQRKPFIITFCGVNGVGKSTNLAKVTKQNTHRVLKILLITL